MSSNPKQAQINAIIEELGSFAHVAEEALDKIQKDMEKNKELFSVFSEKMLTIRGTADQLGLRHISKLAGMAEEIALKAAKAQSRPQIRKCLGALWDAMTTIKYLLVHNFDEPQQEQAILLNRLEATLRAFGGARPTLDESQIEAMLRKMSRN